MSALHNIPTVNILGIEVVCLSQQQFVDTMIALAAEQTRCLVTYANAHTLNLSVTDAEYRDILQQSSLVWPDGVSIVWAARFLYGKRAANVAKTTARNWVLDFGPRAVQKGLRLYILAGKPGIARKAADEMEKRWPGIKVVGFSDGYFQEKSEAAVMDEISRLSPHILLMGMGIKRQEMWWMRNRDIISIPVCVAVGALCDYLAGIESEAPVMMDRLGLEWLWRLKENPVGKWKRYILGNPVFVWRVFRQKLGV